MITLFKHKLTMKYSFAAIVFLLLFVTCSENKPKANTEKKEENKIDSVKVFALKTDSVKKSLVLPGELLPKEDAQIRAKVQGYIRKMYVDIGSKVSKGQVLALIDAPELNSRVQELNEKARAAHSRYLSSKDYFNRIKSASRTNGVIAASELQRVKNQMIADSLEYRANQSSASSARQIGNYLAIIAPYSGIITKRNVVIGSFVGNPNEKPLFELSDSHVLRLQVAVPEAYVDAILLNDTAELTTRSLPGKKIKAKLVRKAGEIDHDSRSEVWEFEVPNNSNELKPGSYADAKLSFLRKQASLVVPASAVVTTLERKFVIRVANGITQWVDVRPGFNMGEKIEIFGDLKPGDILVQKGNEELKSDVHIIPAFNK
jgi:RND family efflux transporter MFP subunit